MDGVANNTLKVLIFTGIEFCDFRDFWPFSRNSLPTKSFKTTKPQCQITAKLNTCRVWDSLFPNIWSKYDIDTCILHIFTYSKEIRVSVTCLITIAMINNRKIDTQWDFSFLIFTEIAKLNTCEMFFDHQIAKLNTSKM